MNDASSAEPHDSSSYHESPHVQAEPGLVLYLTSKAPAPVIKAWAPDCRLQLHNIHVAVRQRFCVEGPQCTGGAWLRFDLGCRSLGLGTGGCPSSSHQCKPLFFSGYLTREGTPLLAKQHSQTLGPPPTKEHILMVPMLIPARIWKTCV